MKREELVEKLVDFYSAPNMRSEEAFINDVEEVDDYCSIMGDKRCYPMEDIDEHFDVQEVLQYAFNGHDENSDAPFCPYRNYYRIGDGAIVSTDFIDYSELVNEETVNTIIDYAENCPDAVYLSNEAQKLLLEYFNNKED